MPAVSVILWCVLIYTVVGIAFALAFFIRGASAIDDATEGAPIGFRLIIAPAAVVLWPWLLVKWRRARRR
jgi:hypothetical protein